MTTVRYTLRLPPALHVALTVLAAEDRRSLHGEILMILDEAVQAAIDAKQEGTRR
jgi:hypothetical protein